MPQGAKAQGNAWYIMLTWVGNHRNRVLVTKARVTKSRLKGNFHARFGSGVGAGDRPADHSGVPCQAVVYYQKQHEKHDRQPSPQTPILRFPPRRPTSRSPRGAMGSLACKSLTASPLGFSFLT